MGDSKWALLLLHGILLTDQDECAKQLGILHVGYRCKLEIGQETICRRLQV